MKILSKRNNKLKGVIRKNILEKMMREGKVWIKIKKNIKRFS